MRQLVLAALLAASQLACQAFENPDRAVDLQNARDLRVLADVRPTEIGQGEARRVGYSTVEEVRYRDRRPVFLVPRGAAVGSLAITRLLRCERDAVEPATGEVWEPRAVGLWVAAPVHASAQRAAEIFQETDAYHCARPATPLEDGAYCLHTGTFADGAPLPQFAVPFVVGGLSRPVIRSTDARMTATGARLEVALANEGDGELNDAQLVVTLQRKQSDGGTQFCGRVHRALPAIAAGAVHTTQVSWGIGDLAPGTYFFHGFLGDATNSDSNGRAAFDSESFEVR